MVLAMTHEEKIRQIERHYGGPVAASKAAGVRYPTWYRWRTGLLWNERAEKTIELMSIQLPPSGDHTLSDGA
jgi:hypothetical protein